ncbi:MAG TPA: DUF4389 domain-containing protein [Gaiellaceae bacterium]
MSDVDATPEEPTPEQPTPEEPTAEGPPPPVEPPRRHTIRLVDNDDLNRPRLKILVRWLLAIPHFLWLALYSVVAVAMGLANWIVTLIKGRPPERVHRWLVRYLRYSIYVYAYVNMLARPYPPFHGEPGSYPVDVEVEPPDDQRRLITAFRLILAIPALILNWVFSQVLQIIALLGWLVGLAIGRMPRGMDNLGLYCLRYQAQTWGYLLILTDRYPSLAAET